MATKSLTGFFFFEGQIRSIFWNTLISRAQNEAFSLPFHYFIVLFNAFSFRQNYQDSRSSCFHHVQLSKASAKDFQQCSTKITIRQYLQYFHD